MKPGWSAAARKRWVEGEPAPDPAELFKAMATMFALLHRPAGGPCRRHYGDGGLLGDAQLRLSGMGRGALPLHRRSATFRQDQVFEVLGRLVFRPLSSSNMTGAAPFRTLHSQGGCLLLDEAERLKNTQDPATMEILSMLLAGYKKGGAATRLEPVGDTFKTVSFDVYGPKALACIAGCPLRWPAALSRSRCFAPRPDRTNPGGGSTQTRGWQGLRDASPCAGPGTWPDVVGTAGPTMYARR